MTMACYTSQSHLMQDKGSILQLQHLTNYIIFKANILYMYPMPS